MDKRFIIIVGVLFLAASPGWADGLENQLAKANQLIRLSKGNRLAREGAYEKAVQAYKDVLKKDPKDVTAHLLLGLTYARISEYDKAIEHTKKASKIEPSYTPFYNLGLIYAVNNKPEKAIKSLDQALIYSPKSHMAEYHKGLVYASQNDYEKAKESYQRAIQWNPNFDDARVALTAIAHQKGDKATALKQVEELRKLNKDSLAEGLEAWISKKES